MFSYKPLLRLLVEKDMTKTQLHQYDGQIYDIDGICNYHAENYIPVSYLQDTLLDFLHIPGKPSYTTDQQIANIILKYKEEHS